MSTITKEITLMPEELWQAIQRLNSEQRAMLARLISKDDSPDSFKKTIRQQLQNLGGNESSSVPTPNREVGRGKWEGGRKEKWEVRYTEYPHIVRVKGVLSGEAIIEGHRIGVWHIAQYYKSGMSPEEFLAKWDYITPAEYYSALAYYFDHQEEIEKIFRDMEEAYEEYKRERVTNCFF